MDNVLGNNVKAFRDKLGLTQDALADYLGISRGEMNYFENGKRSMPSALVTKAAELFCVDEYDLYEEDFMMQQANIAFAFRADNLTSEDLEAIASFKKIAMNYMKMQKVLSDEQ